MIAVGGGRVRLITVSFGCRTDRLPILQWLALHPVDSLGLKNEHMKFGGEIGGGVWEQLEQWNSRYESPSGIKKGQ